MEIAFRKRQGTTPALSHKPLRYGLLRGLRIMLPCDGMPNGIGKCGMLSREAIRMPWLVNRMRCRYVWSKVMPIMMVNGKAFWLIFWWVPHHFHRGKSGHLRKAVRVYFWRTECLDVGILFTIGYPILIITNQKSHSENDRVPPHHFKRTHPITFLQGFTLWAFAGFADIATSWMDAG